MNKCLHYNEAIKKLSLGEHYVPTMYQQVEYLQSTGTQYIDTGAIPTGKTKIETSLANVASNGVLFGSYNSSWTSGYGMYCNANQNFWYHYNCNTQISITPPTSFILVYDKGNTYINGSKKTTVSEQSISLSKPLYLLAGNWSTRAEQPIKAKLYYCKFYTDGTLVRNFIPCYRKSDSVAGMYDTVSKTFFTNSGTGTFIVGPNI